jgi:uncharacterized membrane protein YfhO
VVSDTWFPGWKAEVDGAGVRLWRANHAFRAVAVPAGDHRVAFRFRPRSMLLGAVVSAIALVVAAIVARRRR